jgi:hypothetical protein
MCVFVCVKTKIPKLRKTVLKNRKLFNFKTFSIKKNRKWGNVMKERDKEIGKCVKNFDSSKFG